MEYSTCRLEALKGLHANFNVTEYTKRPGFSSWTMDDIVANAWRENAPIPDIADALAEYLNSLNGGQADGNDTIPGVSIRESSY